MCEEANKGQKKISKREKDNLERDKREETKGRVGREGATRGNEEERRDGLCRATGEALKEGHVSGSVAEVRTAERTHIDISLSEQSGHIL